MNPKYCTDLEHSRKLVAAGWTKETEFWWANVGTFEEPLWKLRQSSCYIESFSAPLTDELLEELPDGEYGITKYTGSVEIIHSQCIFEGSMLNALADLWCWWKEKETK